MASPTQPGISIHLAREAFGLSELHVATINGNLRHVRELIKSNSMLPGGNKGILEARDQEGSTPLMTAVLCGRLEIAKLLLRHGALRKSRDHQGQVTWKYSRASLFNLKLSVYRQLGFAPLLKSQQRERRRIAIILRNPAALRSCRRCGSHQYSHSRILKGSKDLLILKPSGESEAFRPGKEGNDLSNATTGFIASAATAVGNTKVEQLAVSGWKPNPGRGSRVLDNVVFTELVREIIHLHGLNMCGSRRDNGNQTALPEHKGRFAACHVEKKLATWWVVEALKEVVGTSDVGRIAELRGAEVPNHYREARIFLDHGPCRDCWDFLGRIKRLTGILICVEQISFYTKGDRGSGIRGCANCICEKCVGQKQNNTSPRVIPGGSPDPTSLQDEDSDESETETEPSEDGRQPFELEDKGVRQPRQRAGGGGFIGTAAPKTVRPKLSMSDEHYVLTSFRWTVFPSTDLRPVAKPLNRLCKRSEAFSKAIFDTADPGNDASNRFALPHRPASRSPMPELEPSPVPSPGSEVTVRTESVDPVSTFGGHSAYFDDENSTDSDAHLQSSPRTSSPHLHPMYLTQHALNLECFAYGRTTTTEAPGPLLAERLKGSGDDSDDGINDNILGNISGHRTASHAHKGRSKPRREIRREFGFRSRSTFARAVAARSD